MTRIPEKAQKAATLTWSAGHSTVLWVDMNDNTRDVRVYQRVLYPGERYTKATRHTGKNIGKLMAEVDDAVAKGEATWAYANAGALVAIRTWVEHLEECATRKCAGCGEICTATDRESASEPGQWYCSNCWNGRVAKLEEALK